jgi:hypothetical protein
MSSEGPSPRPRIRTRTALWLGVAAAVSCGIVGLLVLVFDGASSLGPSPAARCAVAYAQTDAQATFDGTGATTMCNGWHTSDASWALTSTAVAGGTSVCTGKNGGLSWTVTDGGDQQHGKDACAALSQWAQGGSLVIP